MAPGREPGPDATAGSPPARSVGLFVTTRPFGIVEITLGIVLFVALAVASACSGFTRARPTPEPTSGKVVVVSSDRPVAAPTATEELEPPTPTFAGRDDLELAASPTGGEPAVASGPGSRPGATV